MKNRNQILGERLLDIADSYSKTGREGKPCTTFPTLTAYSTQNEIQAAAMDLLESAEESVGGSSDKTVREVLKLFFYMCAANYVSGLQKAQTGGEAA